MRIVVLGGDGFCGWPTSLRLASAGHKVLIIDNLSRRLIDHQLKTNSLTKIYSINKRIKEANKYFKKIEFKKIDIALEFKKLKNAIKEFNPHSVVHFAEQRSAPYSMIDDSTRRYTVNNNIQATHNVCSSLVEINKNIHLVHLGTMGVYGYSKDFGVIPEGYLDISIPGGRNKAKILYPTNPGSIYHMTKSLDQLIFQFYNKNWQLKVTDLHQGIVWGTETKETKKSKFLMNRFDYDGIYGTVLNRFIVQSANNLNLSVYGVGGQKRAFIHINDTAECIKLAIENNTFDNSRVRIFNQVSEVRSVKELALIISKKYGSKINFIKNPRKEMKKNDLEVLNEGLKSLGFNPILLSDKLINEINLLAEITKNNFNKNIVLNSPKW